MTNIERQLMRNQNMIMLALTELTNSKSMLLTLKHYMSATSDILVERVSDDEINWYDRRDNGVYHNRRNDCVRHDYWTGERNRRDNNSSGRRCYDQTKDC